MLTSSFEAQTPDKNTIAFNWPVVSLLLFLTAIPAIPGLFIMSIALLGPDAIEGADALINKLHFDTPSAVAVHGGAGFVFFLTVPFQFSTRLRAEKPGWHKFGGRMAFSSGIIMALSGIWMHHVLFPGQFGGRYVSLVIMSLAICVTFALAVHHIIKRNIRSHKMWMTRAVAISLAAVTPLFVELLLYVMFAELQQAFAIISQLHHDYGRLLAIVINLMLVELLFLREKRNNVGKLIDQVQQN